MVATADCVRRDRLTNRSNFFQMASVDLAWLGLSEQKIKGTIF